MITRILNLLRPTHQRNAAKPRLPFADSLESSCENYEVCIVYTYEEHSGWILDAIADHLFDHFKQLVATTKCRVGDEVVPKAKAYFHIHWLLYFDFIYRFREVAYRPNFVFFTHPTFEEFPPAHVALLNSAFIVSMCTQSTEFLIHNGVNPNNIKTEIMGCDEIFLQDTGDSCTNRSGICLSSRFHPRKNPDLLLAVVSHRSDLRFCLAGKHWEEWSRFPELARLPNFDYVDMPFSDYANWYRNFRIFLSTSTIEGGPMPLLESMNCGCLPVVSDTGFARDILSGDLSSLIFPQDADHRVVSQKLDEALSLNLDPSSTARTFTWERFCGAVTELVTRETQV